MTQQIASIGDIIRANVQEPYPQILRVQLSTPEACAYGNELIATGRWTLETDSQRIKEPS